MKYKGRVGLVTRLNPIDEYQESVRRGLKETRLSIKNSPLNSIELSRRDLNSPSYFGKTESKVH